MDLGELIYLLLGLLAVFASGLMRDFRSRGDGRPPAPAAPRPVALPVPLPPTPEQPGPAAEEEDWTEEEWTEEDWTEEGGDLTPEEIARQAEALGQDIAAEAAEIARRAEQLGRLEILTPAAPAGTLAAAAPPAAPAPAEAAPVRLGPMGRRELRRAILLAEVLGPPRSLRAFRPR